MKLIRIPGMAVFVHPEDVRVVCPGMTSIYDDAKHYVSVELKGGSDIRVNARDTEDAEEKSVEIGELVNAALEPEKPDELCPPGVIASEVYCHVPSEIWMLWSEKDQSYGVGETALSTGPAPIAFFSEDSCRKAATEAFEKSGSGWVPVRVFPPETKPDDLGEVWVLQGLSESRYGYMVRGSGFNGGILAFESEETAKEAANVIRGRGVDSRTLRIK